MPVSIADAFDYAMKAAKKSGAWDNWNPQHSPEFLARIDEEYARAFPVRVKEIGARQKPRLVV